MSCGIHAANLSFLSSATYSLLYRVGREISRSLRKNIKPLFLVRLTGMMKKVDQKRRLGAVLTVFIEYKVDGQKRNRFLERLASMPDELEARGARQYRFLEGWDQPNLFVEMFEVDTVQQYQSIKAWRLNDEDFCGCVIGGAAKVHVWAFRSVE
jgi:hypothetical protein